MPELEFNEFGECECCRKQRWICRTGACAECLNDMIALRDFPELRDKRLGQLKKSENGIIQDARRRMMLETNQAPIPRNLSFTKILNERDRRKQMQELSEERIHLLLTASPEKLAENREDHLLDVQLADVNAELIKWLAAHPEDMRQLPPRKFEEVIAEILRDQGHEVELTKATRDGGWDIYVVIKTSIGKILAIVECKRWSPPNKVGLAVVERFIHAIREKSKANLGLIVATTSFSPDAQKHAKEYSFQVRLTDFDQLRAMAAQYGQWKMATESEIWIPDYSGL